GGKGRACLVCQRGLGDAGLCGDGRIAVGADGAGPVRLTSRQSHTVGIPVRRAGSISSGRGPLNRLCMWTIKAIPNSGVARLTIGIDTKAALINPPGKK